MTRPYAISQHKDKGWTSAKSLKRPPVVMLCIALMAAVTVAARPTDAALAAEPSLTCGTFYGGRVSGDIRVAFSWAPDRIGRSSCREAVSVARRAKKQLRTRNWTCRGYGQSSGRCLGLRDKYAVVIVWRPAR